MIDLTPILEDLRRQNPATADRLTLSKRGTAVGFTDGDRVLILYSLAITGELVNCDLGGGKYPTFPLADW